MYVRAAVTAYPRAAVNDDHAGNGPCPSGIWASISETHSARARVFDVLTQLSP